MRGGGWLVTGGDGFLGRALVRTLTAAGEKVVKFGDPDKAQPGEWFELRAADALTEFVRAIHRGTGFTTVVHLAAVTRVTDENLAAAWETNVTGTANLLAALAGLNATVVFASSAEVYGTAPAPWREDAEPRPVTPYALTKLAGENLVRIAAEKGELAGAAIVRPGIVYGPGQAPAMMVPELIAAARRHEPLRTTPGEQTRDLLFIDDAVAGLVAAAGAAEPTAPVFNLGAGTAPAVREIVAEIRKQTGHTGAWEPTLPYRADEVMDYRLEVARAAAALGWQAKTAWREGLARTVAAAREKR